MSKSTVYRVGYNAQPSDIDGSPGWYWTDSDGETYGPFREKEDAQDSERRYLDEKTENNYVKRNQ